MIIKFDKSTSGKLEVYCRQYPEDNSKDVRVEDFDDKESLISWLNDYINNKWLSNE